MYDAIVVGSRCAGSATAMLLARKGARVLLVDRVTFPSDTLSTHFIHVSGVAALGRLGVLDEVRASGCPPIHEMSVDFGPFAVQGRPRGAGDVDEMFCCRRTVLDTILVKAAAEAGAEVRQGFVVEELLRDERGAVCGVRGSDGTGTVAERASIVIGADGRHSFVARAVQAVETESTAPLTCAYYSYWSGVECERAHLFNRPARAIAAMPTNDGLTCVFVAAPVSEFHALRADPEGRFMDAVAQAGDLAERMAGARREERFRGTADLPNFVRQACGAGWALVGDAGCHKDPVLAQGITDALRDAELLASAVAAGLADGDMTGFLAGYQRRRDEIELPRYRFAVQLASLAPPPSEQAQLLSAVAADPAGTRQFLGLLAGTVEFEDFFDPANVGAIFERSAARSPLSAGR